MNNLFLFSERKTMRVFLTATALILMIAPAALLLADPPEDAASPPAAPLPPTFPNPTATVQGQAGFTTDSLRATTQWNGQAPAARFPSPATMVPIQVWDGEKLQTIYQPQVPIAAVQGYPLRYGSPEPDPRDQQARELAIKFRQTEDKTQQAELREELVKLTEESFKAKLDARREEIAAAEKQLATMKERLDQREKLAEEIINRRVASLLDEPDPLDWDDERQSTGYSRGLVSFYNYNSGNATAAPSPNSAPSRLRSSMPNLPGAPPVNVRGIASGEEKEIEVPSLQELERRYVQLVRQVAELQAAKGALAAGTEKDPLLKANELADLDQRLKTLRSALADLTARTMLKFELSEISEQNSNQPNEK